jgi:copper resistance protein B
MRYLSAILLQCISVLSFAMGDDDPLTAMVKVDKLETAANELFATTRFEGQAWAGYDLSKLVLKSEIEREDHDTESSDLELLYSRAVAPFWDLQIGWKHDFRPGPERDWLAIGFQGLAPYFFEVDSTLYANDSGESWLDVSLEYELLLTQKLILTPEIEFVVNGYNDEERGAGSGFSSLEAGLRLRYEFRREFGPYIGIHWEKLFGNSADFARQDGEDIDDVYVVLGVRAWF